MRPSHATKKRTLLTSIGVFAGMFFFTFLTGIGNGINNSILANFEGVASDLVFMSASGRTTLPFEGYKNNREISISYLDYLNLKKMMKSAKYIATMLPISSISNKTEWVQQQVSANGKSNVVWLTGISENLASKITPYIVVAGRLMKNEEISQQASVCMIGSEIVDKYFSTPEEAIGKYVYSNGLNLKIVGVVKRYSDAMAFGINPEYSVLCPLGYAIKNNYNKEVFLFVVPNHGYSVTDVSDEIFSYLSRKYHIHPDDKGVVTTFSMKAVLNLFSMTQKAITILIWVLGLGTLLTGAIGVSNILLVTVSKRQREIGIKRAIGASPALIRRQFMLESLVIIIGAGGLGLITALLLNIVIGTIAENTPKIGNFIIDPYPTPMALLMCFGIMLVIGILASLLPVYKALKIKAIDAIQDE